VRNDVKVYPKSGAGKNPAFNERGEKLAEKPGFEPGKEC
jgi:hypothetical protein